MDVISIIGGAYQTVSRNTANTANSTRDDRPLFSPQVTTLSRNPPSDSLQTASNTQRPLFAAHLPLCDILKFSLHIQSSPSQGPRAPIVSV